MLTVHRDQADPLGACISGEDLIKSSQCVLPVLTGFLLVKRRVFVAQSSPFHFLFPLHERTSIGHELWALCVLAFWFALSRSDLHKVRTL